MHIITIPVEISAGGLRTLLKENGLEGIRSMRVKGLLNGADIRAIRMMKNLQELYLEETQIVSGGGPYFAEHMTEEDMFGPHILSNMPQLEKLTLPRSIKRIQERALDGCSGLKAIIIPPSVEDIDELAFYNCSNLADVIFEDGKEVLGFGTGSAFSGCPLRYVYMGRYFTYGGFVDSCYGGDEYSEECSPFKWIETLASVTFGKDTEYIPEYAFERCHGLKSVSFHHKVILMSNCFGSCNNLTEIVFHDGMTRYDEWANPFSDCKKLKTAVFTENVNIIDTDLYSNICMDAKEIHMKSPIPPALTKELDNPYISEKKKGTVLIVPKGCGNAYAASPYWNDFKDIIEE